MKRIVTRTDLAHFAKVSLPTVDSWVRAGCPVVSRGGRGKEWQFDTADVTEWRIEKKVALATGAATLDTDELKRRKLQAETELAELELAKSRGEVASVDEIERVWSNLCAEARIRFRNIPARVVSVLVGETDERKIKEVLLSELDQVLDGMADFDASVTEQAPGVEDE